MISHKIDSLCLAFQTASIEFFSAEGMDKSEVERQLKLMNSQDTNSPSFFSKFIELQVGKECHYNHRIAVSFKECKFE